MYCSFKCRDVSSYNETKCQYSFGYRKYYYKTYITCEGRLTTPLTECLKAVSVSEEIQYAKIRCKTYIIKLKFIAMLCANPTPLTALNAADILSFYCCTVLYSSEIRKLKRFLTMSIYLSFC